MKKILLLLSISISLLLKVNGQCSPNSVFTSLVIPGVYPPAVQIPNLPFPLGIAAGSVGITYSQTLTLVVLEDTIMDIASFLPANVVSTMSLTGIPTVMSLGINHVTFDVTGLPNELSYTCDQSNCEYPSGVDGCILINGNPTQSGNFSVPVSMTINAQIPAITDPFLGTTIFAGMAIDVPSFSAVEYDFIISGGTAVVDYKNLDFTLFPNPTTHTTTLNLKTTADVKIYNVLGNIVINYLSVKNTLNIKKSDLGVGVFYVSICTKNQKEIIKLIIK